MPRSSETRFRLVNPQKHMVQRERHVSRHYEIFSRRIYNLPNAYSRAPKASAKIAASRFQPQVQQRVMREIRI